MEAVFSYRRQKEDAEGFIKKVDSLVEKLLKHSWDKETLKIELLTHCCNDREAIREIKIKDCRTTQEVEDTLKRFDRVREETVQVDAIRNYRDAVTGDKRASNQYPINRWREPRQSISTRKDITCWTCGDIGLMNRQCPKRNMRKCFECGSENHIKRDCDKVRCFRCNGIGHRQYECYAGRNYSRHEQRNRFTITPDRKEDYGRSNYQTRRPIQRRINVMGDEERTVYTRTGDDCMNQGRDGRREEDEDGYPNEEAPSEAELIGALNRI